MENSKMHTKILPILLIVILLLSGCNLPGRENPIPSPTADVVATEVQRLLTQAPTSTPAPTQPAPSQPSPTLTASLPPATDTPAPSPTAPATLTATVNPSDPASSLGSPTWKDTLDTAKNFYLYENENTRIEMGDGALKLTSLTAIGWHGWTLTYAVKPANFYLEGTFKTGNCSGTDLYGLIFRASKENAGYFFGITCDGQFNLFTRDFNNNLTTEILAFQSNAAIVQGAGQVNRVGVLANGNKLSLYVNGVLLTDITDSTYTEGYFGPFIAGNQTTDFTVELDEIAMWKLN
jgi:hypothetical protein